MSTLDVCSKSFIIKILVQGQAVSVPNTNTHIYIHTELCKIIQDNKAHKVFYNLIYAKRKRIQSTEYQCNTILHSEHFIFL